jgi:signal transduction histidine kinase
MKNKRFLLLSFFICVNTIYSYANIVENTFFYDGITASIQQHKLLTISLPFWKSWWLTAFMALLVTLVIFFYIRLRTNSLINQNIQLEEKVNLMTNQLQDKNTELSNSMENQRRLQNQLIVSEKMASLGQLTAGIAHEIQNPLNFINNFSELSVELLEELEEIKEESEKLSVIKDVKQNLEKIVVHGKRADSIVKSMLQHSRKAPDEKIPTDINKLVEEFFVLAYHGMRAKDPGFNCVLEKLLEPGLPLVPVIPQEVSRVILNIFNNSFYAVDERGKSGDKNYKPKVSISTRKANGNILIKIHDNGKGIPPEIREKIFNPFFTTKPSGDGTGLGLSISYDIIVNGHNGELFVDSVPGEFTEFNISLPIK